MLSQLEKADQENFLFLKCNVFNGQKLGINYELKIKSNILCSLICTYVLASITAFTRECWDRDSWRKMLTFSQLNKSLSGNLMTQLHVIHVLFLCIRNYICSCRNKHLATIHRIRLQIFQHWLMMNITSPLIYIHSLNTTVLICDTNIDTFLLVFLEYNCLCRNYRQRHHESCAKCSCSVG